MININDPVLNYWTAPRLAGTNTEPLEVSAWSKEQESIKKIVAYIVSKVTVGPKPFWIQIWLCMLQSFHEIISWKTIM